MRRIPEHDSAVWCERLPVPVFRRHRGLRRPSAQRVRDTDRLGREKLRRLRTCLRAGPALCGGPVSVSEARICAQGGIRMSRETMRVIRQISRRAWLTRVVPGTVAVWTEVT